MTRSRARAPRLCGGCIGRGERRRGSPRRSGVGGAVGQRDAAVFDGGGAGTVVTDDVAHVLHHGERKRRVRWGSRRAERGVG
jgi:hypothetical protein